MNGVYGPLYQFGIEAIKWFRPKWFLAENVGGLRNANDGRTFNEILKRMQNENYTLTSHLYRFEEYGVPQARHRIIIIGIRDDQHVSFKVPSTSLRYQLDNTCRKALEGIPLDADNHEFTKQSSIVEERLSYIEPGENVFNAKRMPEYLRLNVKGARISQIYKRLDPDKPAYTVMGSGGGGTQMYHWEFDRALTNRERARLQTFPDKFYFHGSKESVRKQIGMAVPCQGAKILFEAILNTFARIPYDWVKPNIPTQEV